MQLLRYALYGLVVIVLCIAGLSTSRAAALATEKDAIAIAAAHPPIAKILTQTTNWTARAYDSGNSFQIWRVEFRRGDDQIGWVDVGMARHRVYAWEANALLTDELSETQRKVGADAVIRFLKTSQDIQALLGSLPIDKDAIDYNAGDDAWTVSMAIDNDPFMIAIRFQDNTRLTQPHLIGIYFTELTDYATWVQARSAEVIALAFQNEQIAAVLHKNSGWVGNATPDTNGKWTVVFQIADRLIVTASVDLHTRAVTAIIVNPA